MTPKPKIQYIGQFYVYGSEARAIAQPRKKPKTKLPPKRVERATLIRVDGWALASLAAALVVLIGLAVGSLRVYDDWMQYQQTRQQLVQLNRRNVALTKKYQNSLDLEAIRSKAEGMGLVDKDSLKVQSFPLTRPEPEPERTWLEDLKWFFDGLLE